LDGSKQVAKASQTEPEILPGKRGQKRHANKQPQPVNQSGMRVIWQGRQPIYSAMAAVVLVGLNLGSPSASAQTSWAAAANGNWNTAGSWNPAAVPTEGTTVSITIAGTYTVTYNSPMAAASIGSLTLGSATSIPTLTLTAAGFNVSGSCTLADSSAEVLNINSGGVMNNATLNMVSRNALVNVNTGGVVTNGATQVANNSSNDGTGKLTINSGATASLGNVTVGRHNQSGSLGLQILGGTVLASSIDIGTRNSYSTMAVSGGTVTNAGNLRLGTGSATAGRETRFHQTGGTVGVAGTVDLPVANNYTAWFSVLGASSTLYAAGIRIYPNAITGAAARLTNSGTIYLGANGFKALNPGTYTVALNDQSVLGAAADWSGNANMVTASGTVSFKAADAGGVAHDITLTNTISGGANVAKLGTGTLALYGANSYAGNTVVSAGRLIVGNATALPKGTGLTVGGSGTSAIVDLAGFSPQVGGLATAGIAANQLITNSSAVNPATLTFSNSMANATFGGLIAGSSQPIALTILGGNLTLTGANAYAGNLFISNGKLALNNGASTFTGAAIVLSNSTATLDISGMGGLNLSAGQSLSGYGVVTGSVISANCRITPGANGGAGILTFTNNLTFNGAVTNQFDLLLDPDAAGNDQLIIGGAFNVTGVNVIQLNPLSGSLLEGTYKLIKCGALGSGDTNNFLLTGSPGINLEAALSVTATGVDLVVSQAGSAERDWRGDGVANLWDHTTTNWLNNGSPQVFSDANFVRFDDAGSNTPAITLVGALAPKTVTVDAVVDYAFSGAGKITGAAVLSKTNSGTLTILTTNDFSGPTTIDGGALQLGNGLAAGSLGTNAIQDNDRFIVNLPGDNTFANLVFGTGTFVQSGPGMLTLTASNTYSGGTLVNAGTLQVNTGAWFGSGKVTNNGLLAFNRSGSTVVSTHISGSGAVALRSSGTVTITTNNSYSGGTTVSNGTLLAGNVSGSATGTGTVTVSGAGKLAGTGFIAGAVAINSGATLAPGNPLGTLTINNDLTVNSGAVLNFALGTNSSRVVVNGNLILNGTLNVSNAGGLFGGSYTVFTYTGGLTLGTLTIGTLPPNTTVAIDTSTPGQVNLIVAVLRFDIPSFPGALGFGARAYGGRTGSVYHVTTLADSGAGSFRTAVSSPNRTVVFDVGGYIELITAVSVRENITIAGQTAPGGGIGFKGGEISFANRNNIICRYIRIRPGSDTASDTDDALSLYRARNVILDHVSMEFAPWNNVGAVSDDWQNWPVTDVTFQNCINANPTGQQFGAHTESVNSTMAWFYTIFANSHNRNPMSKINDMFINNVLYNCSAGYTTHTSTPFDHDIVNNYFIAGPGSSGNLPWYQVDNDQSIYYSGNYYDSDENGVLGGGITTPYWYQGAPYGTVLLSPWSSLTSTSVLYSARAAYRVAVSQAGALPRDQVDDLVISQVKTLGNGSVGPGAGTAGPDGGFYTSQTQTGLPNNGYGVINGGLAATDTDGDGMPDYWETALGSNPNFADNNLPGTGGYTKLENYLNWLADPHAVATKSGFVDIDLWRYTSGFTNVSPVYSAFAATNGTVAVVLNNHTARFSATAGFSGLGSFRFSVAGSDGSQATNAVGILVTAASPQFQTVNVTGGNVLLSGDGGIPNSSYYLLGSTNLAWPLNAWARIATNQFDASGTFTATNFYDAEAGQYFYRLQLP
jgi:autotransporter-associated beta strand protein